MSPVYWWAMGALVGFGLGRWAERKFQRAGVSQRCGLTRAQAIGIVVIVTLAAVAVALLIPGGGK